ncbi:MAG: DinB family protein [Planctomycetaceae bacterium]
MSPLSTAIDQIQASRRYTERLLDNVDESDWFRMPVAPVTHLAWQLGHLAIAQYRLCLERIRGARPDDATLIPAGFAGKFGKDSVPVADPANYPSVAEIRGIFDRVHQQALRELAGFPESDWFAPPVLPHMLFDRKIDSLYWCARHEMMHSGQIGLLRRLLGHKPLW